jgi:DNA-binding NarL/FixJ family response regulator
MIKVLIADDHAVLRHGLRLILQEDPGLTVVGEAANGTEAVAQALSLTPDVMLMDVEMPDMSGIEATRRIRAACPETHILILTVSDRNKDLLAAFKAGARGYLLKNMEGKEVLTAIHRVAAGEVILPPHLAARLMEGLAEPAQKTEELTGRELDVLQYIAQGLGNKEIATALNISENTVKTHVRHILAKLNLRSRAEAAAYAVRAGLAGKN